MRTLAEIHFSRKPRRDQTLHGFEALSEMIRNLEALIDLSRFDPRLSLTLDGAQLLREEWNEGGQAC